MVSTNFHLRLMLKKYIYLLLWIFFPLLYLKQVLWKFFDFYSCHIFQASLSTYVKKNSIRYINSTNNIHLSKFSIQICYEKQMSYKKKVFENSNIFFQNSFSININHTSFSVGLLQDLFQSSKNICFETIQIGSKSNRILQVWSLSSNCWWRRKVKCKIYRRICNVYGELVLLKKMSSWMG